jgi:transcriptional regulator with XRE-family HTH domain
MSTSIFGKTKRIVGELEDLGQYVRRILEQKRLSFRDVQKRSGGRITQGYVGAIVSGRHANPSVEKLKALAQGLGEPEEDVFRVARGLSSDEPETPVRGDQQQMLDLVEVMYQLVLNQDLLTLLQEMVKLTPEARQVLLQAVRALSESERSTSKKSQSS